MTRRRRREFRKHPETPSTGFSPRRGRDYFVIALIALPLIVVMRALSGGPISPVGAIVFVLGFAVLAGVLGMFTDNIGF